QFLVGGKANGNDVLFMTIELRRTFSIQVEQFHARDVCQKEMLCVGAKSEVPPRPDNILGRRPNLPTGHIPNDKTVSILCHEQCPIRRESDAVAVFAAIK